MIEEKLAYLISTFDYNLSTGLDPQAAWQKTLDDYAATIGNSKAEANTKGESIPIRNLHSSE